MTQILEIYLEIDWFVQVTVGETNRSPYDISVESDGV